MTTDQERMEVKSETVGELKEESFLDDGPEEAQEGKSLDELAGEGKIATPETGFETMRHAALRLLNEALSGTSGKSKNSLIQDAIKAIKRL